MSSTSTSLKPSINKVDVDMPVPGNMADKENSPRLSPVSNDRIKPERQYSRDKLIELMTHPLSSAKHPCLEIPLNKTLVSGRTGSRLPEDRWDHRRRTDSLTDEDRSDGSQDPQKKRISDPKAERLRKDQDVVLSPQRRSFNSGCFVNLAPQNVSNNRRPESPHKGDRDQHREIATRRIGSGRIIREPVWDFRSVEKEDMANQSSNNHDFSFRQRDDRFDRRMYERSHDKERPQQQRTSRYNNDRRKTDKNEPEEPEWFSGGPTSQHDTIELHGFEGPVDEKAPTTKKQNKNSKNSSKNNRKVSEKNEPAVAKKISSRKTSPECPLQQPRPPSAKEEKKVEAAAKESHFTQDPPAQNSKSQDLPENKNQAAGNVFNVEDFLNFDSMNFDSLPSLLSISNGCVDEGGSGSRFSQFFRRNSPPQIVQQPESRHSSTHDEMFNSMINDITNTSITIPGDGNKYFAPISPAAATVKENFGPKDSNLLEMLQLQMSNEMYPQGRKITKRPSIKDLEISGKLHSVEELEARLGLDQGIGKPTRPTSKEEELAAFRKLMMNKQMHNIQEVKPAASHTSVSGAYHSQQQQSQAQHGLNQQPQVHHTMPQQQAQQMPIPHDLVMKLLQVQQQQRQQEMFSKLLAPPARLSGASSQFTVPPPIAPLSPELQMHINNSQPSKDLLQRPEAQSILRSLKRGDITVLHLVEQLKRDTTMQPIQKEIIASIIKLHSIHSGVGVGQREPSPANLVPPSTTEQLLQILHNQQQTQHQQQQLRIPSPHTNVLQRVPSPRELVAHTQNILQNALLKKKLEEQKENFRKRQEMQRSHSPNMALGGPSQPSTTSPTPLAFTPTSVLRKMTADKEGELGVKQLQQHDLSQQPPKQGRAIVKGNNKFSVPPPVVPPSMDFMSMPPQYKNVQRNKIPQTGGNPQQHFMMGVNRNNIQPPPVAPSASRGRNMGGSIMPQQQQQGISQSVTQLLMNHNNCQQRNSALLKPDCQPMMRNRNYNMGYTEGSSSPVSNQLARWFSPELLAQARAGKLPDMPPISPTQNMLSVEEIERLQQAVHN